MHKLWQSIFWKVLSCGCFAGINVLVRYLSGGQSIGLSTPLPIYTIMFYQNLIGMLILSSCMWPTIKAQKLTLRPNNPWMHYLRILAAALGIALWYISLRYIPVTQVVALSFVAPIITTICAILILKEKFNIQRKLAVGLSFIGGFLIARPDHTFLHAENYTWYMLLPLLAAIVFSLDKILTRHLLQKNETPQALAWYLLAFIAPLCILPAIVYGWVNPSLEHLPWLGVLGLLGALAHYTFNKAYALADVTVLLPFGAAKLIMCAGLSYLAFSEIPRTLDLWLGIAIITFSTVVLSMDVSFFSKARKLVTATP